MHRQTVERAIERNGVETVLYRTVCSCGRKGAWHSDQDRVMPCAAVRDGAASFWPRLRDAETEEEWEDRATDIVVRWDRKAVAA